MDRRITSRISRSVSLLAVLLLCLTLSPSITFSQVYGTDDQTVTVIVQPVTIIQINVGTVNLNITGINAIAGQDEMTITDQSSMLLWGTNSSLRKITAMTSLASPIFVLKVVALNPTVGTAGSEITLSTMASDLVTDIGRSSGSSNLRYTGIALASQGIGTDSHSITFTIQAQ